MHPRRLPHAFEQERQPGQLPPSAASGLPTRTRSMLPMKATEQTPTTLPRTPTPQQRVINWPVSKSGCSTELLGRSPTPCRTGLISGRPTPCQSHPTGNNAITGLPWSPATDGLRNITGRVNDDGTVTDFGLSPSTVSGERRSGRRSQRRLVSITDDSATLPAPGQHRRSSPHIAYRRICRSSSRSFVRPNELSVP